MNNSHIVQHVPILPQPEPSFTLEQVEQDQARLDRIRQEWEETGRMIALYQRVLDNNRRMLAENADN